MKQKTQIKINSKYFVEIDQYNYILFKKTKSNKSNKLIDTVIGYFPSMQYALKAVRRTELSDMTTDMTLDTYLDKLQELEKSIR